MEFLGDQARAYLADIKSADDLTAQTDDGAAVMPGNIATANQKYFHGSLLLLSIVGNQAPPSRAREICGM